VNVRVRRALPGDGEVMSRVFDEAARAAWTHFLPIERLRGLRTPAEDWECDLASDDRVVALLAENERGVVGFAVVRPSRDADADPARTGELDTFYALPSVWRLGVGRALMAATIGVLRDAEFEEATLWTAEQNHRSRHFYEAAGWRRDGAQRRKSFVGVEFTELRYRIGLNQPRS
jgi:GNAT superfamily N-acetyltransferase